MKDNTSHDSVNSPDLLKKDPQSLEFYILRDEKVVVCKDRKDVPYWQNRSTYLSAGRLSPKFKKVVFWPGPVNPKKAMELLQASNYIDKDFNYAIADVAVKSPKPKKGKDLLGRLNGVRKAAVEHMIERGMKVQEHAQSDSQETKPVSESQT